MPVDIDPRPRHHHVVYAALCLPALAARRVASIVAGEVAKVRRTQVPPAGEQVGKPTTATVKIMGRLGLLYVTAIMTVLSAALSAFIAWLFSFVIHVPNYGVHIFLAAVIPFFVTPLFSYLSALSMRDLQRARKKAVDLARLDVLTGLGNRRAFFETARRLEAGAHTSRAVLFIDIDHFKSINDSFGHDAGDAVLKHFAELLRASTRVEDFAARIGGEEFALHVVDAELTGLAAIASGLLARVRMSGVTFGGEVIRYRVSIGGAIAAPAMEIDKLLSLADAQLYEVKRDGRDAVRITDARDAAEPSVDVGSDEARTRRSAA